MATDSKTLPTASSMPEAASADNSLEGYAAINSNPDDLNSEIAQRAHELYLERGGDHGRHDEDWHRAEAEVRGKYFRDLPESNT